MASFPRLTPYRVLDIRSNGRCSWPRGKLTSEAEGAPRRDLKGEGGIEPPDLKLLDSAAKDALMSARAVEKPIQPITKVVS